jgi:hypothetical protein
VVVPALADVGALRGLANGVQTESAGQLFEVMEVLADRSFGAEPVRLGLADGRSDSNLHELGSARHVFLDFTRWRLRLLSRTRHTNQPTL